jgi:hypothetical protein
MSGVMMTDLFIARIDFVTIGIAYRGCKNDAEAIQISLQSPKATTGKPDLPWANITREAPN